MSKELTVTPAQFKKGLDNDDVRFILDLRETDEFEAWRIEGHAPIETVNIPRYQFVGEEEKYIDRLPRDRQIVVICAHGDSSKYSAELLQGRGFDAVSLDGGMDAWSEYYEATMASDAPSIYQTYRVARGCVSYLISSGGEAAVIDSPRHTENVTRLAEGLGVKVTLVLDTHLHADHISGGPELAGKTGAPYYLNPEDAPGAAIGFRPLEDGMGFAVGNSTLRVIHSPGHTPGSTSFLLDDRFLFTGDTIMKGSIGRPDLGGKASEWAALLNDTLFRRFASLPDDIMVLPAHSASIAEQDGDRLVKFTLGDARRGLDLYGIRELKPFIAAVEASLLENPERYQDIRKVNLGLLAPDEAGLKELEIGKNICGMAAK
jgi:glyoxylase-like metal-dependent hydrolase (beta-lactamase superfamily II)